MMKLITNIKRLILVNVFVFSAYGLFAQPCFNILTYTSCSQIVSYTLSGSGDFNEGFCFATPGNEGIIEYTPLVSGVHSINIANLTGLEFVDFGWKLASDGCSETGWNCISDVLVDGNYGSMNWTAGETYYIIADVEGTTEVTFDFQLNCPTVYTEASDCGDAVSICEDANFAVEPNGDGLIDEIPPLGGISNPDDPSDAIDGVGNTGCLRAGETNSTWMVINVLTGGTLEFSFGAYDWLGGFFDWAMWPYSPTACADIQNDVLSPVRCNWNGAGISFTGIATAANIAAMETTYADVGIRSNFAPELIVANNTQFIICFSNWSSTQTDVPLYFSGTAGISCTPLGDFDMDLSGFQENGKNHLNWYVANEMNVDFYAVERRMDDGNWKVLVKQDPVNSSSALKQYSFVDETPIRGENYYRIKQYKNDGSVITSSIIALEQEVSSMNILSVFPNPVDNMLKVKYAVQEAGNYELKVVNLVGSTVYQEQITSNAGISINMIDVSQFRQGTYLIHIKNTVTCEEKSEIFVKN